MCLLLIYGIQVLVEQGPVGLQAVHHRGLVFQPAFFVDVEDGNCFLLQRHADEAAAVAPAGIALAAHQSKADALFIGCSQAGDACPEKVLPSYEAVVHAPLGIVAALVGWPATQAVAHVYVGDAVVFQEGFERVAVKLRVMPRVRLRAYIDEVGNACLLQKTGKDFCLAAAVADGINGRCAHVRY